MANMNVSRTRTLYHPFDAHAFHLNPPVSFGDMNKVTSDFNRWLPQVRSYPNMLGVGIPSANFNVTHARDLAFAEMNGISIKRY